MGLTTDRRTVLNRNPIRQDMDAVLASLPPAYFVAGQDDARFVVGPGGAFVLLPTDSAPADVTRAAERLHGLALTTRDALCDHLTWVPFLDALLVFTGDPPRSTEVTVAPLDLVRVVLTEGLAMIQPTTLTAIREAVRTAKLDGWRVGLGAGDARIDLCDPDPATAHPLAAS